MVGQSQGRISTSTPQRRRLMLALALLVIALTAVVLNDRQFWFGTDQAEVVSDLPEAATSNPVAKPLANTRPHSAVASKKQSSAAQTVRQSAVNENMEANASAPAMTPTVTRTVLPPLDVEVVAGAKHSTVRPNAAKVEVVHGDSLVPSAFAATTNAAERERLSTEAPQANYPLLAQHMNVQGSVVLQALIGADGIIQDLHVVSGPTILASAAQQAVREWRFKPVFQDGQAVETRARITVNFTIKVSDVPSQSAAGF